MQLQAQNVIVGSQAKSVWLRVDPDTVIPFNLAFAVTLDATANLTYSVQHTYDNVSGGPAVTATRVTTTATMVFTNAHGLTTADSVVVANAGAPFDGTYTVASVVNTKTITYTVADSGLATANSTAQAAPTRVFSHATVAAQTAAKDGTYIAPIRGIRLNATAWAAGNATLTTLQPGVK